MNYTNHTKFAGTKKKNASFRTSVGFREALWDSITARIPRERKYTRRQPDHRATRAGNGIQTSTHQSYRRSFRVHYIFQGRYTVNGIPHLQSNHLLIAHAAEWGVINLHLYTTIY